MGNLAVRTLDDAHRNGLSLVRRHVDRLLDLVAGLGPEELDRRIPDGDWTVLDTVAHLQSVVTRYTTDLRRADTPGDVAVQNAEDVARLAGTDVEAAATAIRADLDLLASFVDAIEPDHRFPFHAGQTITMAGGWGNLLGELLAHGDDIARAVGAAFEIPGDDTELLWRHTAPVLAGWLRPEAADVTERWRLRFPFGDLDAHIDRGELRWGDADGATPDHELVVPDGAALALVVPYGRRAADDPQVALLASRFLPI